MKRLARWLLGVMGWRLCFTDPGTRKYVLVVAPHTSNWDFPLGLLAGWALGLGASWMGKHTLFRGPMGPVFSALGGIPVDRTQAGNMIEQMASRFAKSDHLVLGIAPEGTRSATDHWKSGFYHIARAAGVPIALAFLDYGRKEVGIGDVFMPGADIDTDFERISAFYADKRGKRPGRASTVMRRSR